MNVEPLINLRAPTLLLNLLKVLREVISKEQNFSNPKTELRRYFNEKRL